MDPPSYRKAIEDPKDMLIDPPSYRKVSRLRQKATEELDRKARCQEVSSNYRAEANLNGSNS